MTKGDRLGHSWREGRLLYPGLASDFANMIRAALALYEATGRRDRLDQALRWQTAFDAHYANPGNGGYYLTADDAEGLVVRPASTSDDATPNPNAIAAQNLIRLAALTGDAPVARKGRPAVRRGARRRAARTCCRTPRCSNAIDLRLQRGGDRASPARTTRGLPQAALRLPYLNRIVLRAPEAVGAAAQSSGAGQDRRGTGERSVHLRRRNLLAAGGRSGQDRRRRGRDAAGRA